MQAISHHSTDTEYSADCIEFCPHEGYHQIFICGTYQVLEPTGPVPPEDVEVKGNDSDDDLPVDTKPVQTQRTGRLLLFRIDEDQTSFTELQRIDTPAILDAKWSPELEDGLPVLAVADAKGGITRYTLSKDLHLTEIERIEVAEDTTLCLSLDYPCSRNSSSNDIITSLSTGHLAHLTPSPTGYITSSTWSAHAYEPWIVSYDAWDPNRIWSGGDDCLLKSWDLRVPEMVTGRCKDFEAGVTTIASSPYTEHLLVVGSYDANLRLFDTRNIKSPIRIIPTAGGIWRTKFHPSSSRKGDILIAGMHGGFSVVHLDDSLVDSGGEWVSTRDEKGSEIIKRFEGHSSLAYGADWCRLPPTFEGSLIVSCSFYDHQMHLWRA